MYNLNFITEEDFKKHVKKTLEEYINALGKMDLRKFNSNIIDPIKLLFDKSTSSSTYEEVISNEIQRQRDKTHSNSIGYFHQNIFKYFNNCIVPTSGWDIIFIKEDGVKYYCELKNKHNTMNSSSAQKTFIKMAAFLARKDKEPNERCALVEVISKTSKDKKWEISIEGTRTSIEEIRQISIDKFYSMVTGEKDAFYQICLQLPKTLNELIENEKELIITDDTVYEELKELNSDFLTALYLLAFPTYNGFSNLNK